MSTPQILHRGRFLTFSLEPYVVNGQNKVFEKVQHPGAAVLIAVDRKKRILLVRQTRRAVEREILELPAGILEPHETPEVTANRELQEETGYRARTLHRVGGFFAAPGFCTEYLHCFLASDLEPSPLPPDDDERLQVVPLPLPEILKKIREGEIEDAKTIAGILYYQLWNGV